MRIIPMMTAAMTAPAAKDAKYIGQLVTTPKTKMPPCGAGTVHPKSMERAPAAADPIAQGGIMCNGSDAAKGIAPSVMKDSPMIKLVIVDCRSFGVNFFLKSSMEREIAMGGTMPPIMTDAMMPELTAAPDASIRDAVPKTYAALLIGPPKSIDIIPPRTRPRMMRLDVVIDESVSASQ